MIKKRRILIIGGSGFIGKYLFLKLSKKTMFLYLISIQIIQEINLKLM